MLLNSQRRKSSPEFTLPFKSYQNQLLKNKETDVDVDTANWINSQKRLSSLSFNENSLIISEVSSIQQEQPVPQFLRSSSFSSSFSSIYSNNYNYLTPPLSTSSSHHSYFNTLPAAPLLFNNNSYSSLKNKKKKKRQLRASILSNNSLFDYHQMEDIDSPSSRRSSSDIEFATEIGQGLLSEIRRMQTIIQEKQELVILLENEKMEKQQVIEELSKQLIRQKSETEDQINQKLTLYKEREQLYKKEIKDVKNGLQETKTEKNRLKQKLKHQVEVNSLQISDSDHYQNKIKFLQLELEKEKEKNNELSKSLLEAQKTIEQIQSHMGNDLSTVRDADGQVIDKKEEKENSNGGTNSADSKNKSDTSSKNIDNENTGINAIDNNNNIYPDVDDHIKDDSIKDDSNTLNNASNIKSSSALSSSSASILSNELDEEEKETATSQTKESTVHITDEDDDDDDYGEDDKNASTSSIIDVYSNESNWQKQNMLAHPLPSINEDDFEKADLPAIMHTMIGEWLYKYIRFKVAHGISDNRHRRFFWLHPYTKILYWSSKQPGAIEGGWKAKSATIESFYIEDPELNDSQPAIMIKTSTRNLKIECTTKDSHDKWVQSLNCLLSKQKHDNSSSRHLSSLLEDASSSKSKKKKWRFSILSSHNLDDVSKLGASVRKKSNNS